MGLEAHERDTTAAPANTGDNSHSLNGIWDKPTTTADTTSNTGLVDSTLTPSAESKLITTTLDSKSAATSRERDTSANIQSSPVFTDSDGKPLDDDRLGGLKYSGGSMDTPVVELAAMTLPKFPELEKRDVTQVSDKASARNRPTADDLARVAHDAVGSNKYGNKVPSTASEFKNMDVPQNLKCASTSSEWLVSIGVMTNKDYKIRVDDMIKLLPEKGFTKVPLKGDLDLSKFPDGPIGFITGRGNYGDGSNHIGFIEKRDGQLRVIHNNFETGRVVDQDIKQKFYTTGGKPAYRDMSMFIFPKR